MPPQYIAVVEHNATSVSCLARLSNIVHGLPRYLRHLLFTVQALRAGGQIRLRKLSLTLPFSLWQVGVPSYIFYRCINYKLFPSYAFIPLAALSRSRSWCNNALINSEGPRARQTSRKTAVYGPISPINMSFCAYHRVQPSYAGSVC